MFLAETNPLNSSALVFPVLECLHIAGWALSVGTIALVDFRLLGVGLRKQTAAEIAKDLAPWTLIGLALILLSGPLLFSSDPDMYYLNRSFQFKMVCFVLAVLFNYTIHRKVVRSGASAGAGVAVACVSLLLWVGVVFGGIYIAFV
ncbi:MAG: DUF2214 domain-containing protein [Acidobacteriia bacterium]|nr:DUF2214 domain-containing protein [Terriglobia bacterium]